MSYVRAVRFTDVDRERVEQLIARVNEADGPPEGVRTTGLQVLVDDAQGTAVVLQAYETEQDMRDAEAIFEAMDASLTPGSRASVDRCEVKVDLKA
ncbi:MAG: hypothetical protein QOJ29_3557 [Thermoleophilaceae bacterium]|jgi:hypothetical protein|nr:hypothetical protein [Thermoleophilaceae bacterium]